MTETIVYMSCTTYFRASGAGPVAVAITGPIYIFESQQIVLVCLVHAAYNVGGAQFTCRVCQIALKWQSEMIAPKNLPEPKRHPSSTFVFLKYEFEVLSKQ